IDSYSDTITAANQPACSRPVGPILELAPPTRGVTMRSQFIIAALLSSAIAAGCNGRNNDNSQNPEQNQAAAPANAPEATDQTVAPAPPAATQQPYTTTDNSAVRTQPQTTAPRATAGRRDVPRTTTPSRTEPAPQANSSYNNSASNAPAVGLPPRENTRAEAPAPRLPNAIAISGDTAIPAGSVLRGTVTDVERAGRVQGRAHLSFAFNEVSMNGGRENLKTNPLTFEGEASKGEDATKVGAGAVGGAILGGILGGKKGAAKGAAGGAAAGTGVVLATRGKEVTVTEGTQVTATLAQPMTVRVRVR